jgi:nucleoside-diphosphate-sugar epimerase
MNLLITGADGFVGRTLVKMLLGDKSLEFSRLLLLDQNFKTRYTDARVQVLEGDFFAPDILETALNRPINTVFHLASIPGGAAEDDFKLGKRVNLDGTIALFEALSQQDRPPVVVFTSTIAVYGSPLPVLVNAHTLPNPNISYATQKLIGELLLADYTRRGFLDGRILRLPGIVARPLGPSGMISAFMSDILHQLKAGNPYVCPVSAQAAMWWMSAKCCGQNLIHAATMSSTLLPANRTVQLPALRATMGQIVAGLAALYGEDRHDLVRYQPNPQIEAGFGQFPPMDNRIAQALGFQHDGSVESLITNALESHQA